MGESSVVVPPVHQLVVLQHSAIHTQHYNPHGVVYCSPFAVAVDHPKASSAGGSVAAADAAADGAVSVGRSSHNMPPLPYCCCTATKITYYEQIHS